MAVRDFKLCTSALKDVSAPSSSSHCRWSGISTHAWVHACWSGSSASSRRTSVAAMKFPKVGSRLCVTVVTTYHAPASERRPICRRGLGTAHGLYCWNPMLANSHAKEQRSYKGGDEQRSKLRSTRARRAAEQAPLYKGGDEQRSKLRSTRARKSSGASSALQGRGDLVVRGSVQARRAELARLKPLRLRKESG